MIIQAIGTGLTACLLLGSCGYSMGYQDSGAVRSIAVEVAGNQTFRQRLEIPLTRELNRALHVYSDYQPASFSTADAILSVEIVDIRGRNLVSAGGLPVQEGALDFTAEVKLRDRRSGELLRQLTRVDQAEFRIPVGESETSAELEAVSDLARKIVLALEGDF
ncbi:MAG: LPS assembly lipoprotein LptE [Planctomycetota bacterium]|jgi:hypothetical protein